VQVQVEVEGEVRCTHNQTVQWEHAVVTRGCLPRSAITTEILKPFLHPQLFATCRTSFGVADLLPFFPSVAQVNTLPLFCVDLQQQG
jgi:hypothetical protein